MMFACLTGQLSCMVKTWDIAHKCFNQILSYLPCLSVSLTYTIFTGLDLDIRLQRTKGSLLASFSCTFPLNGMKCGLVMMVAVNPQHTVTGVVLLQTPWVVVYPWRMVRVWSLEIMGNYASMTYGNKQHLLKNLATNGIFLEPIGCCHPHVACIIVGDVWDRLSQMSWCYIWVQFTKSREIISASLQQRTLILASNPVHLDTQALAGMLSDVWTNLIQT